MKIEKNRVVSLIYELRETNAEGRVIELVEENHPMTFIYGSGRLLPHFELNLFSMEKGDNFSFVLKSESAYGDRREDMIIDVPLSIFQNDGRIDENVCRVGNEVPMMDRDGNRINGVINEITDSYVKMDFNHPMAGTDLHFSGKVLDVHDATAEEIDRMNHSCASCGSHDDVTGSCSGSCV
ncbi:MAG: FKBP-type peptidyl-prolyl cis-trans isomerase [Bacteroidales bacterium]|jgi:FKBP-type peptidyl-prolyl cis-trans isomerase SlyD|nr:FKBP-type peptidyl-prolyl cis-trans isomerase [Bacteroidales bacterium]